MIIEQLEAWIAERKLSAAAAARLLGVSPATMSNYRTGKRPIPDDLLTKPVVNVVGEITDANADNPADIETAESVEFLAEPAVSADTGPDIIEVVAPEDLPMGSPGWRYRRGTVLPKGQWREVLPGPQEFANGAVCTAIIWGSSGVGLPKMTLVGSTQKMADPVHDRGSNYYPLAKGAFRPADYGDKAEAAPLKAGELAVGNIKDAYQKGGTKAQHGAVRPKPLMDILDGDE